MQDLEQKSDVHLVASISINESIKLFNLNQLTNVARGNRYASATLKKRAMRSLYYQIKPQVKELLEGEYKIEAIWRVPNLNRDLDNLLLKNIFDCMQEYGMLKNDNLNYISEITHKYELVPKNEQGVQLKFWEVV